MSPAKIAPERRAVRSSAVTAETWLATVAGARPYLIGYPPGEHYAQKQSKLVMELRAGYEHAVSALLEQAQVWEG